MQKSHSAPPQTNESTELKAPTKDRNKIHFQSIDVDKSDKVKELGALKISLSWRSNICRILT
jgi:Ca2+-dependent lipid-binding protein